MPPPPSPHPRRTLLWFGQLIFGTLAVIVFLGSLLLNVGLLTAVGVKGGYQNRQTVLVEGDSDQEVAIVPLVNSMILQAQAKQLSQTLDEVGKDSHVKALVLRIDTPGGSVTASDEIHHRIEQFKSRHPKVPVVVTMGGLATSGGYYAACAGDYLFAEPTTLTGNIGVLMPQYNVSKLAAKYGVVDATIHSTGAPYKEAGSWTKPITPQDTAYLTGLIDSAFTRFKQVVTDGRGKRLTQPIDTIANGMAYTADQAKSLGLVDQVGYAMDAYAYAAKKAGLTKMKVVRYDQPATLMEALTSAQFDKSSPQSATSIPAELSKLFNFNPGALARHDTPQLMY